MAQTTSLVFNGGVIPSPTPVPSGTGKAKLLKIGEITITEQGVQVTKNVICDPDSVTSVAPFMEVVTSAKLAELVEANSVLVLNDGSMQYLMADATITVEDETAVCTSVSFLGLSKEHRAKVEYPCTRVTDELTLQQVIEVGEPVETAFNLVSADSEDTEPGTLIDKLEVVDNVYDPEDPEDRPILSLETTVDGQGNRKVAINEDTLRTFADNITNKVFDVIDTLDSMDFDAVPHGSFGSSLNQSPGDGITTSIQVSIFRPIETTVGDAIEWTKTTEIGGEDFGTVTLEPGTYIVCSDITCQWVGVPAGTYLPQVGNVLGEPFDFSQPQELHRRLTNVVTVSTTTQFKMRISFDAATPVMGFWINSAQIVKIAGGMSQTNVSHDTTLTGQGSVADPLGVTPAAFGKVKDIATSISQFRTGDVIPVDGPNGPAKMSKDDLLEETAQNALAGNLAPAFDPTRTSENPYKVGESVTYTDGKTYTFKVDHYGAWNVNDVYQDGEILGSVNANEKAVALVREDINERGDFVVTSDSFVNLFDGYVIASTGIVSSYQTNAYQIKYKLFAVDSFVKVVRSVASAENANVLLVVDDISKVFVGANVSRYIVDRGFSNPYEETFFVPAGSYFVWGWQSGSANNTIISSADAVKLKTIVNGLIEGVTRIEQDISYYESVENIDVDTLILSSAYVNASGQVKSWSNTNYNIFAYQAQTEEYVKIKRTESVYVNNDVICKCATISDIAVDNYIDGEVLCTGSDYPFETIVHLNAGEYIVRSGTGAGNSIFTKLEKKHVKDKLFPLEGLKVDFEGDSIMAGRGGGGGWPSLIELNEKVVATNNGSSGSKIAGILTRIKSRTPSDYDMIVVQGGFNDGTTTLGTFDRNDYRDGGAGDYDQATFYGAMEVLCRYCLANFSKAMFIVGYNWGNDTWNTTLANACVAVCEKWGMPYVDLRSKAGFNLHVLSLREKYGVYIGDVAAYDPTAGYSLDEQTKYDGRVYKANQNIPSPAGDFDASKWTYIGMEYDQCHCNEEGYKKSVGAIVEMMKSI